METAMNLILVVAVLTSLALLGSSRLLSSIALIGWQGAFLGLLPLVAAHHSFWQPEWRLIVLAIVGIGLKGIFFPWFLRRSMVQADVRQDSLPFLGYGASMVAGITLTAISFWLAQGLLLPAELRRVSPLVLPAALSLILMGLLLIVSRRTALMQTVGYLLMENGIYVFGVALAHEEPFLVEMGVLLDVFVAVFVMGITVFHISREFDHTYTDQLSELRDFE